ncbi:MarR family winged helix-turn-helix transcriptional regulator [Leucobacter chromiireducens]|uniref:MarR family winged helix-turn-helix transcriptional regulator n=1 Tax=Leucobacter chromiireducens TaxID=283877 RepID=UPI000F62DDDB|nr:MarR family transcriptional regulator [Leucobacter chromiireducens]
MANSSDERAALRQRSVSPHTLDTQQLSEEDTAQAFAVMQAFGAWQDAGRALAKLSADYMQLNETDMRAIRMIMGAQQRGEVVTPKDIARAVDISSASTTKLVDRLIAAGHLVRSPHPSDRRTVSITVTDDTRLTASNTIGRQHARRFAVAAGLSPVERTAVIKFLTGMREADQPQQDLLHGAP